MNVDGCFCVSRPGRRRAYHGHGVATDGAVSAERRRQVGVCGGGTKVAAVDPQPWSANADLLGRQVASVQRGRAG